MDVFTKRKMNVLIHLAKIDGDFHKSERKLIQEIIEEKGFDAKDFHLVEENGNSLADIDTIDDKGEMLYLALKLIQADDIIRDEEVIFCKQLAEKLSYKPEVVDHFAYKELPDRAEFDKNLTNWTV